MPLMSKVAALLLLAGCPAFAFAQPARAIPATAPAKSCKNCHAELTKNRIVHAPAADDCLTCHTQQGTAHKFKEAAEGAELCTTCHDVRKATDKYVHGPVAVGDCVSCHDPHASASPKLVRTGGTDLCLTCHVEMKASIAQHNQTHAPVQSDCASCHDPHASPNRYQLKAAGNALCFTCHADTQKKIAAAAVRHDAVSSGRQCVGCHDPHVADAGSQLRGPTMRLCLSCHDKELQGPSGPVQNIKAWLASNPNAHGPIRQQDCGACHRPHESDHFKLLKQDYPAKFYAPFDASNYELCFNCHQPDLVRVERTTTLTGFRDGDHNLHFLHVNRTDKGRTCRACHEVHSSTKPKHIREKVPFGSWQLPIKFEANDGGGTCAPGCHVPYEYRRGPKAPAVTAPARER